MAVVINTNVDSLKIQNILSSSTNNMSKTMQRMSSGLQILSAKDDAAGTVIAARMQVQLNGNQTAQKNVQNANALLSTAEGNLDVVQDNISRIRDLTLQAKNGTYSDEEIKAMQDEVQQRIEEINRISNSAEFSSLRLFGYEEKDATTGKMVLAGLAKNGATFQVGANDGVDNTIKASESLFQSVEFSAMTGARNFNLSLIADGGSAPAAGAATTKFVEDDSVTEFDDTNHPLGKDSMYVLIDDEFVTERSDGTTAPEETYFDVAIRAMDKAIDDITARKSTIGSVGNRMDSALDALTTQHENLSSAKSLITDTDVANQASVYTQQSILQQVSTSLLAQANQAPSIALSLV